MRTPETFYFDQGYIKFKKIDGIIHYEIWNYIPNGMMSYITGKGTVNTQEQIDSLLSLGSVKT